MLIFIVIRMRRAAARLNVVDISPYRGKDHEASSARRCVKGELLSF